MEIPPYCNHKQFPRADSYLLYFSISKEIWFALSCVTWTNHINLGNSQHSYGPELDKSPGWSRGRAEPSALCRLCHTGCGGWEEGRATDAISKPGRQNLGNLLCTWEKTSVLQGENKRCNSTNMAQLSLLKEKIKPVDKGIGNKGLKVYCYL